MEIFKDELINLIKKAVHSEEIRLEIPPKAELGDFAFPCFNLAKTYGKSPNEVANEIASKIEKSKFISQVKVIGPYVNFFIDMRLLARLTILKILREKGRFGSSDMGKGKKIIIEHTSINPNASPHVGRARNALIGDSLVRLHKFQNFVVETHYWVNDVGKQVAILVYGSKGKKISFDGLLKMYIDINKKIENIPTLEKEVLVLLHELENGNKKVKADFKRIVDICLKGQLKIFYELGIKYDYFDFESKYLWDKKTIETLKLLEKTGRFFFDKDNRFVLDQKGFGLGMEIPVLVLTRSDGTSLYPLRDITYSLELSKKGSFITVLGEDHKLYNEQINAALLMLEKKPRRAIHYSYVLLQYSKMSTRRGNIVLLEDFMKEALKKAKSELIKRYKNVDINSAKKIAYGAIKYGILRISPEKNVIFSWEQALSFEGESSLYIQYAYARICSIIKKNKGKVNMKADISFLKNKEEMELLKKIAEFPKVVGSATESLKPHLIANYVYELAKMFNEFYHLHNILKEGKKVKDARLLLCYCIRQVLNNGLGLLGIDAVERL